MNVLRKWFKRRKPIEKAAVTPEALLERLDEPFRSALLSMYHGEPQTGSDGKTRKIDPVAGVIPANGMWLYDECLRLAPRTSLEVGFAFGFSTLFILAGIAKNGSGMHLAVDQFEVSAYGGVGLQKVQEVCATANFRFVQESSVHATTDLEREHSSFDFIFIDGNHRFDDALVDFTLFSRLLNKGGLIVFDDLWMPSLRTAVAFVQTNREDFLRIPSPPTLAAFERIGDDARLWEHFIPFAVARK
jgi:predicted O-methyltransferase YrrM